MGMRMSAFASMNELVEGGATGIGVLAGAAAVAGLASSLHCFAMCGPLACAGCARASQGPRRRAAFAAYHVGRITAYMVAGGLFGLAGAGALHFVSTTPPRWIPWAMAAVLLATALGWGERVASVPGVAHVVRVLSARAATLTPLVRAGATGALTPFLPCGLLYGLFATALLSGSPVSGSVLSGAFAAGGVPALALAQLQTTWIRRLPRGSDLVLRRLVPLGAALVLVYRALTPEHCPLCP
jgi:sulfite exporter TauE/SafE